MLKLLFLLFATPSFAAVTVTVNGSNHTIPQTNEKGWGANVTAWIQAISQYTLQPSGGTFTLTAEVNTGATYGFKVPYIKSATTNAATAGVLRLAKTDVIDWRNNANGGNLALGIDGSDNLTFNGGTFPSSTSANFQDSTFSLYDNGDNTKLIKFDAAGITTGTTRTVTVPDANLTMVGAATTQTLTNKVLSGNTAVTLISGSGTLTLNTTGTVTVPNATDTLVGKTTTDTLTNKVLNGNTATNLISGSGTLTLNTSGTITVPNGTDTLVAKTTTDTLTNKTLTSPMISGPTLSGTITTPLTASRAMVTGASNELAVSAVTATELGYVSGATSAIQTQITLNNVSATASYGVNNCSLAASVGSNALTIALKDAGGSDPSGSSPCVITFRNGTAATGTWSSITVTAATSVVVSSGSTLGCTSALKCRLYVYAIASSGSVVLGVINGAKFDEATVQTATAEGGAGAADSPFLMYATAAQSSKPVRLLGRIEATEATAGTWATTPSKLSNVPLSTPAVAWTGHHLNDCVFTRTNTVYGDLAADATCTFAENTNINFGTVTSYQIGGNNAPGIVVTPKYPGVYQVCASPALVSTGQAQNYELLSSSSDERSDGIIALQVNTLGVAAFQSAMCGVFVSTSSVAGATAVTLSFQSKAASGATQLGVATSDYSIWWSIVRLGDL